MLQGEEWKVSSANLLLQVNCGQLAVNFYLYPNYKKYPSFNWSSNFFRHHWKNMAPNWILIVCRSTFVTWGAVVCCREVENRYFLLGMELESLRSRLSMPTRSSRSSRLYRTSVLELCWRSSLWASVFRPGSNYNYPFMIDSDPFKFSFIHLEGF